MSLSLLAQDDVPPIFRTAGTFPVACCLMSIQKGSVLILTMLAKAA